MALFPRRRRGSRCGFDAAAGVVHALEQRLLFTAYFVNASASTNGSGSSASPWNKLSSVTNFTGFHSGDVVNLTGTFSNQTLTLGSAATGITVTSSASNPAQIVEPSNFTSTSAIQVSAGAVTLSNLKLVGPGATASSNSFFGIWFPTPASAQFTGDTVNNVSANGFVFAGLEMQGGSFGYTNASITNSNFSNNQVSGIVVEGSTSIYSHVNLNISNCIANTCAGYAIYYNAHNAGQNENFENGGIFISSVNGAVVQHCTTIGDCYNSSGAVGTWAYNCTGLNFQYDESGDTRTTLPGSDGHGFDFDHGVTNSIFQYCYSHGNDGSGYFLCDFNGLTPNSGDTIRYCISNDDGLTGGAGILIYGWSMNLMPHSVLGAEIYNNTILESAPGVADIALSGLTPTAAAACTANFMNNILYSASGGALVDFSYFTPSLNHLTFEGNDYWTTGSTGNFAVKWGSTTYTSPASWIAATGEETINAATIGTNVDPLLVNETVSDLPIANVSNLKLSTISPLRGAGLNLLAYPFASSPAYTIYAPYNLAGAAWNGLGTQDYFGDGLTANGSHDAGAQQISALVLTGSAGGDTLYLKEDAAQPHTLDVNAATYNLSGIASVVINGSTGNESVTFDFVNGPLANTLGTLSQGITLVGGTATNSLTTVNAGAGSSGSMPVFFVPGSSVSNIMNAGAGVVTVPAGFRAGINSATFTKVTIANGAEVVIANPTSNHSSRTLVVVSSGLTLAGITSAWTGTLDLGSNDLDVKSGNLTILNNMVAQGWNDHWQISGGIISSAAANDTTRLTTLGVIQNTASSNGSGPALYGTFDSNTALSTDVLVKYTYYGDANLSGAVDGSDYSRIDSEPFNNLTGWFNGDFNYDTHVDGSDYTLIDNAYNSQGASFAASIAKPASVITTAAVLPAPLPRAEKRDRRSSLHSLNDNDRIRFVFLQDQWFIQRNSRIHSRFGFESTRSVVVDCNGDKISKNGHAI